MVQKKISREIFGNSDLSDDGYFYENQISDDPEEKNSENEEI